MTQRSVEANQSSGKLLLVVDDDPIFRQGLATLLQGTGYQVQPAANGQEALEFLQSGRVPELILLDMLMPILDGWHFLRALRADPRLAFIPILVSTGTILTAEWAVSNSCAGFLRKPFEIETLLQEIARCLGPTKA